MSKRLYRALIKISVHRFRNGLPNVRFQGTKQFHDEWYNQIKDLPIFF